MQSIFKEKKKKTSTQVAEIIEHLYAKQNKKTKEKNPDSFVYTINENVNSKTIRLQEGEIF